MPEIRPLTEADAAAYREVRLRGLRDDPDAVGSSYAEEAARPLEETAARLREHARGTDRFILGAFSETGELLGIVGLFREQREKTRHKATVFGMFVVPAARGAGPGRALMAELLARVRQMAGLTQIQLTVVTHEAAARRLYHSLGFVPFGLERQALRLGDEWLDAEHLVLFL